MIRKKGDRTKEKGDRKINKVIENKRKAAEKRKNVRKQENGDRKNKKAIETRQRR